MANDVSYVKTGIPGVDSVLKGGIYPSSAVTISGPPGSGKSIFGMQFIYYGAKDYGEDGLIISVEESNTSLSEYARSIGWGEWDSLVEKGAITVISNDYFMKTDLPGSLEGILEMIQNTTAKRLVLDSINLFKYYFPEDIDRRRYLLKFIRILKRKSITTLLLSEVMEIFPHLPLTEEMYLSDGNIFLFMSRLGNNVERCFWVTKMRRQDFNMNIVPMGIGKGGIEVYADSIPYSLEVESDRRERL
ncbi:ATPase [Methanocella sp. CWC-04]|uniref:ATPase n=1 Tax=Methanooceanicella nereidis TaxID=2052831 RepID=A0AAP2W6K5_9EURY|nr:ATPase domain-containing protein [Methanocella sp. CWC-04]MCD1295377.1 ATPase [Methanocella sp. CWC-04]